MAHPAIFSTFLPLSFSVIPPPLDSSSVFALRMKLAQSAAVNYGINFSNDLLFPPLSLPPLRGFFSFFFFLLLLLRERISFLSTRGGGKGRKKIET